MADESEIIAIDPYAGWVEAGSTVEVSMSVPNNQINYAYTTLDLEAVYESLTIPVSFGLSLSTDEHGDNIIPFKNQRHY